MNNLQNADQYDHSGDKGSFRYLMLVCLVASLGGLLFGFDTAVISGTVDMVTAQFSLTDLQSGWFTSSAIVGCIAGALVAGFLAGCLKLIPSPGMIGMPGMRSSMERGIWPSS